MSAKLCVCMDETRDVCDKSDRSVDEIDDVHEKYGAEFGRLCGNSTLDTVKLFAHKFEIDDKLVRYNQNYALYFAAHRGHYDTVVWLVETFHYTADEIMPLEMFDPLAAAISGGHPEISRWLASHFDLVHLSRVTDRVHATVESVCATGNKDNITWLIDTFGVDCMLLNNRVTSTFRSIFYHGETKSAEWVIENAKWLIEKFGEKTFRTSQAIYDAFDTACITKQFHVAEWLIARFRIGKDALRAMRYAALINSINYGPDETVDWLLPKMNIDSESDACKAIFYERYANSKENCERSERVKKLFACISITSKALDTHDGGHVFIDEPVQKMVKLITGKDLATMSLDDEDIPTSPAAC